MGGACRDVSLSPASREERLQAAAASMFGHVCFVTDEEVRIEFLERILAYIYTNYTKLITIII